MGRAEFQYDEVGNTFYYVLISFYAIVLIPITYFILPNRHKEEKVVDETQCQCRGCLVKRDRKEANKPWKRTKVFLRIAFLLAAWGIFFILANKVASIEVTHNEYDPYAILGLDTGAEAGEIRKKYRELTKKLHPDRGGDPVEFDKVAKAYQALTDDEARQNWEKYGNPDGPTATTFGIALPKWLVSKEYGVWVLAFYGMLFMIVLPVAVGIWWYNSIKYSQDKVLLDTTQLFYYFIHRTPKMEINRMLMVMTGAFEFSKSYNAEVVERETDDTSLPRLMKHFPNLGENRKERPLCMPYALKARILAYAYLSRQDLENADLETDQTYILTRLHRLIEEFVSCTQQLTFYSQCKVPFETMENVLKTLPMFTQALWPKSSPLLQLPHIGDHNLNFIKRNKVHNCPQLANLDEQKRKQVLNSLDEMQYRDVLIVLSSMPQLQIDTHFEVAGEDDKHEVTAKCLVTLKVTLTRRSLLDRSVVPAEDDYRAKSADENSGDENEKSDDEDEEKKKEEEEKKPKRKVWEKQPKKGKGKPKQKPKPKPKAPAAAPVEASPEPSQPTTSVGNTPSEASPKKKPKKPANGDSESDDESQSSGSEEPAQSGGDQDDSDVDEDWAKPPKNIFESKSKETHPVHAPFYPGEKFEWWWLSLTLKDHKQHRRLVAPVTPCKTLVDSQTIEMRFNAPDEKGIYTFTLGVHSDSYMDADYSRDLKLDVKETKIVAAPKYESTDDEEEEKADASSEEEYTEESDDE